MEFDDWARSRLAGLLRFAMVLSCDPGVAEDTVQEVLFKAHKQWDRIQALDSPEHYVRRMIVNEYLSWRRKWSRIIPSAELRIDKPGPDHAEHHADRAELVTELAKLPPKQRAVIALRYFADLPDPEIAEMLGCSTSTVRSQAFRALARLRIELTAAAADDVSTETGGRHAH
jgi:RNA polymerase sigma-70 factor (sigma-E family)